MLRLWKNTYSISLYEIFVRETSRSSALYFPSLFLVCRRELWKCFQRLQQFRELGRGFCSRGFPLSFLSSHWFRSWSWEIWLARHGRHCCLVKSQADYSFGRFNSDSFSVVSGYQHNMGYLRSPAGLMFCSYGFPLTPPCPYPVGDSSFVYCGNHY